MPAERILQFSDLLGAELGPHPSLLGGFPLAVIPHLVLGPRRVTATIWKKENAAWLVKDQNPYKDFSDLRACDEGRWWSYRSVKLGSPSILRGLLKEEGNLHNNFWKATQQRSLPWCIQVVISRCFVVPPLVSPGRYTEEGHTSIFAYAKCSRRNDKNLMVVVIEVNRGSVVVFLTWLRGSGTSKSEFQMAPHQTWMIPA